MPLCSGEEEAARQEQEPPVSAVESGRPLHAVVGAEWPLRYERAWLEGWLLLKEGQMVAMGVGLHRACSAGLGYEVLVLELEQAWVVRGRVGGADLRRLSDLE
jgi:hypothetical protein